MHNSAMLTITNNGLDTIIFHPKEVLGIIDLRPLGYHKIKQGILQQKLSKFYRFKKADTISEHLNQLINRLKKERQSEESKEKYSWLDPNDERKYMTDKETLEVMDMVCKYKEAFGLRDEIGTCPSIEVEINVMDKSIFFIRPYHVKEEDKTLIDKELNFLCYLGTLKEGFSAYSSPVMLISRKLTQDKRVVTDFRHLNVRIAKNNLAYPLVKDMFLELGSFKCEVLSVLNLKDAFHLLRLLETSKRYCRILPYFGSTSYQYQRMPMGLNISPSIWQSYINTKVDCLHSRKYCEVIMDDHLLFTHSKGSHMAKLEDLLKALLRMDLRYP